MLQFNYMNMRFNLFPKNVPEQGIATSKAESIITKFTKWIQDNNYNVETLDSEQVVIELVNKKYGSAMKALQVTTEQVINELKSMGFLVEVVPEKVKQEKVYEEISLKKSATTEFKIVDDPEVLRRLEENKLFESLEKEIFRNDKELDLVYEKSLQIGKENNVETIEDYYKFADAGLIRGGRTEVKRDFEELQKIMDIFKKNNEGLDKKKANNNEKAKKLATISERAIVFGVSNLNWCGDNVTISPTSNFDDVKRGVDEIMQIESIDGVEFLGLGIDVTYRGLLSESYRNKLTKQLQSIYDGYSCDIKYFKNQYGEMMSEFSVPKIPLYIDFEKVKDLVRMINNIDNPEVLEQFKESPQRFSIINQIITICDLLGDFAESCHNDISVQYHKVSAIMKEMVNNNPEIKNVLDGKENNEITHHIKYLIQEWKNGY